jgi:hypothetical protein
MTAIFNASEHHHVLSQTRNYAARENILNDLEWRPAELGNTIDPVHSPHLPEESVY